MRCNACANQTVDFDYTDSGLHRNINSWGKIKTRRETRLCAKHQRKLNQAIKRARFLAILPYTNK